MDLKKTMLVVIFGGVSVIFVLYQLLLNPQSVETQARVWAPRVTDEPAFVGTQNLASLQASLSESAYLNVPYTVQAPYAKWDVYDEESCEEAALLMAHAYLEQETYPDGIIPKAQAQTELKSMIDYQTEHMGLKVTDDLFPKDIKKFTEGYWPEYTVTVLEEISALSIKKEIAGGNPVVVPATAGLLENPWYRYQDYHMLTVIGYENNEFITNDPGTKRGEDWRYAEDKLIGALEDSKGKAVVLVKKIL